MKDAIDALFGTTATAFSERREARVVRSRDGAWRGPGGPVYTRSSAVRIVERLSAWSVSQRSPILILNPWARPLGDVPMGVEVREVVHDRLQTCGGRSLREIFDLPEGWPE